MRVPVQLQRAMAAEAEAAREARAKVVAAEGEQKASVHLKEAAKVLEQSNSALQLRYLQVKRLSTDFIKTFKPLLESHLPSKRAAMQFVASCLEIYKFLFQTLSAISSEQSSTIVFPFPMDTLCLGMEKLKEDKRKDD